MIKFSIVIPIKNPGDWLVRSLDGIRKQRGQLQNLEVILLNSGEEQSCIVELFPDIQIREITIDPSTFNHGATRNVGVQEATGEVVVFTVQDAAFCTGEELGSWGEAFEQNPTLSAVSGYQSVEHIPQNNPAHWYRPQSVGALTITQLNPGIWDELPYLDQRKLCSLDNVVCAYRKQCLLDSPFDEIMYGEDIEWGKRAILRGDILGFHGAIRVWHHHNDSIPYIVDRLRWTHYIEQKLFGQSYIQLEWYNFRHLYLILTADNLGWMKRAQWAFLDIGYYAVKQVCILLGLHKKNRSKVLVGNQ
ncbi:MAG: glycosyltransferase involved in cell wall biosynthesis [Luteibaculaceae bacterium]|jgi:glycosyltransferase involved in cell wall biosynthesis